MRLGGYALITLLLGLLFRHCPMPVVTKPPLLLFWYFPQYYEAPENAKFWGSGFTDWVSLQRFITNPATGHPLQRPTELGYYSLLRHDIREQQRKLLQQYGGYGFIFHHYWFNDRPVLHEVLEARLKDGEPAVPFFLNWVNQSWRRRWHGLHENQDELLLEQTYNHNSSEQHFAWLLRFFKHPQYIRVRGMPVLSIHQGPFPDALRFMLHSWQQLAKAAGLRGIFIVQVLMQPSQKFTNEDVDGLVENHPSITWKFANRTESIRVALETRRHRYHWRGVYVNWDNTPRMGSSPSSAEHPFLFERHLATVFRASALDPSPTDGNFVVINAWNEWAEGMVMEPSDLYGRGFLRAMHRVLQPHSKEQTVCALLGMTSSPASSLSDFLLPLNLSLASLFTGASPSITWEVLVFLWNESSNISYELWDASLQMNNSRCRFTQLPARFQTRHASDQSYTLEFLLDFIPRCKARVDADWMLLLRPNATAIRFRVSPETSKSAYCDGIVQHIYHPMSEMTLIRIDALESGMISMSNNSSTLHCEYRNEMGI